MGWVWKDDEPDTSPAGDNSNYEGSSGGRCSTRRTVSSQCRTEETEPGKFIRKCEKTEEIFRDCLGRPSELVQSNKEYTEEDVTDQINKGLLPFKSKDHEPFDFPGLRSDIEGIERSLFGGLNSFFEAAEEMRKGFFSVFGDPYVHDDDSSASCKRRGIPIEGKPSREASKLDSDREASPELGNSDGEVNLSGLAKDV